MYTYVKQKYVDVYVYTHTQCIIHKYVHFLYVYE